MVGVSGSRKDALEISQKIKIFLKETLELELSPEKTEILHAGKDKAHFMGYNIYSPTPKESFYEKGMISKVKKRASHVSIYIDAPYTLIKERLIGEGLLSVVGKKWFINAVTR